MRRPPTFSLLLVALGCVLVVLAEAAPAAASSALAASTFADFAPTAVLGAASVLMMTAGAVSMVRRRRGTPRDRTDP